MNQLPVDYLSASAHKFHGPKGVGFLFVRKDRDLPSYIHGGSQENGKRAGTENVAGIVGMAKALEIAVEEMQVVRPRIVRLRNYFVERVLREIPQGRLNGHPHKRLPGNVNSVLRGLMRRPFWYFSKKTESVLPQDLRAIPDRHGSPM